MGSGEEELEQTEEDSDPSESLMSVEQDSKSAGTVTGRRWFVEENGWRQCFNWNKTARLHRLNPGTIRE